MRATRSPALMRHASGMRARDHARMGQQRVIGRRWFALPDIETRPAEMFTRQRRMQGALVMDAAPRGVDEQRPGPHVFEEA